MAATYRTEAEQVKHFAEDHVHARLVAQLESLFPNESPESRERAAEWVVATESLVSM